PGRGCDPSPRGRGNPASRLGPARFLAASRRPRGHLADTAWSGRDTWRADRRRPRQAALARLQPLPGGRAGPGAFPSGGGPWLSIRLHFLFDGRLLPASLPDQDGPSVGSRNGRSEPEVRGHGIQTRARLIYGRSSKSGGVLRSGAWEGIYVEGVRQG